MSCEHCLEEKPCIDKAISLANPLHYSDMILLAKNKKQESHSENYNDIQGPNQVPPGWCEEVVTGVGRAMDAIACLAKNYAVKVVLIGLIESMISRGVKCCQTGNFWKACVAPISRKWQEWDNNKKNKIFPNDQNLPLYLGQ